MSSSFLRLPARASRVLAAVAVVLSILPPGASRADSTAQTLPFSQNWTNIGLITTNDNWSGVPGIIGYSAGRASSPRPALDPQTAARTERGARRRRQRQPDEPQYLHDGWRGGVRRSRIRSLRSRVRVRRDAPYHPDSRQHHGAIGHPRRPTTCGTSTARRQRRPAGRAAVPRRHDRQLHERAGGVRGRRHARAQRRDHSSLPCTSRCPRRRDNQPLVQIRIITTDAAGSDEWVGIDDISITGTAASDHQSVRSRLRQPEHRLPGQASLSDRERDAGRGSPKYRDPGERRSLVDRRIADPGVRQQRRQQLQLQRHGRPWARPSGTKSLPVTITRRAKAAPAARPSASRSIRRRRRSATP